jgi:hypothetical protein
MILISPIGSGIKLFNPKLTIQTTELQKIDVFCNLSKVSEINCPVFIIHGMLDDVIPHTQSIEMVTKIKYVYDWFPNHGTHNNILYKYRAKFYSKVSSYLEYLSHKDTTKSKDDVMDFDEQEKFKISINTHRKDKKINYEENYMSIAVRNANKKKSQIPQYSFKSNINIIKLDSYDNISSNQKGKKSPIVNYMSVKRQQIFDFNNCENLGDNPTQSVDQEGEYIFSAERISDCNNYNYQDAKELEYQFNQIQKNAFQ